MAIKNVKAKNILQLLLDPTMEPKSRFLQMILFRDE